MLYQDMLTGYFHEVPDDLGYYSGYPDEYFAEYPEDIGQYPDDVFAGYPVYALGEYPYEIGETPVMNDGFGNPLGLPILAALAPIAKAVLPTVAAQLAPQAARLVSGLLRPQPSGGQRSGFSLPTFLRRLLPF